MATINVLTYSPSPLLCIGEVIFSYLEPSLPPDLVFAKSDFNPDINRLTVSRVELAVKETTVLAGLGVHVVWWKVWSAAVCCWEGALELHCLPTVCGANCSIAPPGVERVESRGPGNAGPSPAAGPGAVCGSQLKCIVSAPAAAV